MTSVFPQRSHSIRRNQVTCCVLGGSLGRFGLPSRQFQTEVVNRLRPPEPVRGTGPGWLSHWARGKALYEIG
jgi:hypothetical protein